MDVWRDWFANTTNGTRNESVTFRITVRFVVALFIIAMLFISDKVSAQEADEATSDDPGLEGETLDPIDVAPVEIDGETYFVVRGARSFTAEERAAGIAERILQVADRPSTLPPNVVVKPAEFGPEVYADGEFITVVTESDGDFEQLEPDLLAEVLAKEIKRAIVEYRTGRTSGAVEKGVVDALMWTVGFVTLLAVLFLLRHFFRRRGERRIERWVKDFEGKSGKVIDAEALLGFMRLSIRGVVVIVLAVSVYYYVALVLQEFAITKGFASLLLDTLAAPLLALGQAALGEIPDLVTLVFIVLIARYLLKLLRLFFVNIENGVIVFDGFDPAWTWPTHRIARFAMIISTVVVCYPYIPGADTDAFKGMSILLGLMVSLGANSIAANLFAGLIVVYKRSVNVGDRIQVGETVGDVEHISLLDAHVRSLKNEMVSIPNTKLLGQEVMNYTRMAGTKGLIVYTSVGIGYDESQAQVEHLLVEAARATSGVKATPAPFVLRHELGASDVRYELNAYSKSGVDPVGLRSRLNTAILDQFHGAGVQIMTPNYIADPESPKIPTPPAAPLLDRA